MRRAVGPIFTLWKRNKLTRLVNRFCIQLVYCLKVHKYIVINLFFTFSMVFYLICFTTLETFAINYVHFIVCIYVYKNNKYIYIYIYNIYLRIVQYAHKKRLLTKRCSPLRKSRDTVPLTSGTALPLG